MQIVNRKQQLFPYVLKSVGLAQWPAYQNMLVRVQEVANPRKPGFPSRKLRHPQTNMLRYGDVGVFLGVGLVEIYSMRYHA